jgi:hypothetical protein
MNSLVPSDIFGTDLWCQSDIDPGAREVGGTQVLLNALYRRAISPRGCLIYDPNYGYDLSQFVNDDFDPTTTTAARIASGLDNEFRKDPRVLVSQTSVTLQQTSAAGWSLTTTTNVQPAQGPAFQLVIGVSALSSMPQILNTSPQVVTT